MIGLICVICVSRSLSLSLVVRESAVVVPVSVCAAPSPSPSRSLLQCVSLFEHALPCQHRRLPVLHCAVLHLTLSHCLRLCRQLGMLIAVSMQGVSWSSATGRTSSTFGRSSKPGSSPMEFGQVHPRSSPLLSSPLLSYGARIPVVVPLFPAKNFRRPQFYFLLPHVSHGQVVSVRLDFSWLAGLVLFP